MQSDREPEAPPVLDTLGFSRLGDSGEVLVLEMKRPRVANAFDSRTVRDFHGVLNWLESVESVRALVVTGTGRYFCSGADLSETNKPKDWLRQIVRMFNRLADLPIPSVAAINGAAVGGGCELALSMDMRIIAEEAYIGLPEITFGGLAFAGGPHRLTRLVGPAVAKELHLTGRLLDSAEAARIGLVNRVASPEGIREDAVRLALDIAQHDPKMVRYAKWLIDSGVAMDGPTIAAVELLIGEEIVIPGLEAGPS